MPKTPIKAPDLVQDDAFARRLGIEILEYRGGYARVKMPNQSWLWNSIEVVHGGALFTLADYAFALASNTPERLAVSVSAHMEYLAPGRGAFLEAEAQEVSSGKRIGTFQVRVTNDMNQVICLFTGTAYYRPIHGDS